MPTDVIEGQTVHLAEINDDASRMRKVKVTKFSGRPYKVVQAST